MLNDPISDFLTRIRNAQQARHRVVEIPNSKLKLAITKILFDKGYILSYKVDDSVAQGAIKIALKYDRQTNTPAIQKLQRASRPGLRKYANSREIPRVMNGLGVSVISTSQGVMTDKEARSNQVGGEVICYIQ